jgi:RNA polymerase sigma-70 factor, ECF subfamily
MSSDSPASVKRDLLASIPHLRALAIGLCGRRDPAEDLVQETLTRAWANLSSFEPGTNLKAWLYTILRNEFYSDLRKRRREVADPDGALAATLTSEPAQQGRVDFQDLRLALARLPPTQREAVLLVGASSLSYEDAARICNCAVGTMKSRVHRARLHLADLFNPDAAAPHQAPPRPAEPRRRDTIAQPGPAAAPRMRHGTGVPGQTTDQKDWSVPGNLADALDKC